MARPVSVPFEESMYHVCQRLDGEYHSILVCQLYNDLRKQLIARFYWVRPNMYAFVELLNTNNEQWVRNLGTYITKLLNLDTLKCSLHRFYNLYVCVCMYICMLV